MTFRCLLLRNAVDGAIVIPTIRTHIYFYLYEDTQLSSVVIDHVLIRQSII